MRSTGSAQLSAEKYPDTTDFDEMIDLSPYLAAYGLQASDLSAERQRQLSDILLEAGRAAGGVALQKVISILSAEAGRKSLPSGTPDSEAQRRAVEMAQRELDRELARQEQQARTRRILWGVGIGIAVVVGAILLYFNRKS